MRTSVYIRRALLLLPLLFWTLLCAAQNRDSEQLGMALEYFNSGKYHEALLKFERLEKQYRLNPRFHAYMGVCYYYEWQYDKAVRQLEEAIPQLTAFAPHERSFYYFAAAESYFNLGKYGKAVPLYEAMINLCYEQEKGDALYRLGFCYLMTGKEKEALDYFESALAYYKRYRNSQDLQARQAQLEHMIKGLRERVPEELYVEPAPEPPAEEVAAEEEEEDEQGVTYVGEE